MDDKLFWYKGSVDKVIDGDTIDVTLDLGLRTTSHQRVRLLGTNTPEIFGVEKETKAYQAGVRAKTFVEDRVLGRMVWIRTYKDKAGKYGTYRAEVFFQDDGGKHVSIGKLLLEEGLAEKEE